MWFLLGLFGAVGLVSLGQPILALAGLFVGFFVQVVERKSDAVWDQVEGTSVAPVWGALSILIALLVAVVCFAVLGIGLAVQVQP